MELILILFPGIIAIITSALMSKKWEKYEKVDKGIELCYWKLSYRRKFIRTLWLILIGIIIIVGFYKEFDINIFTGIIEIVIFSVILMQAFYNYKKWKNEIRQ